MGRHTTILVLMVALTAGIAAANVSNMALAPDGTIYTLSNVDDHLSVLVEIGGEIVQEIPVPQTTGIVADALSIAYASDSSTLVLLWQEQLDEGLSRILLASWNDETWFGPVVIAGDDGIGSAANPTMMLDRIRLTYTADEETGEEITVEQTAVHFLWWYQESDDAGWAEWASIWLDESGVPMIEELNPLPLHGILPYGVGCELDDQPVASLAHPHFFRDPMTGDVHMLIADLEDCVFHILRLSGELQEDLDIDDVDSTDEEPTADRRRRRMVIVLGFSRDIAISPNIRLENAEFEVGYDMSVVTYWDDLDEEEQPVVRYVTMHESGWSDVQSLTIGERLNHEDGVALIRRLASQPR